ncbi:hypothetical protein CPC08DRAFT_707254 [Agrocybe pediades]|nr:hypothetical protein CPC08DRAFT_707254 [Agrocybe pediades]
MSRQDGEPTSRPRARANTTSFTSFPWTKPRRDQVSSPEATPINPPTPSLEALIQALSPPAVPSLNHARNLATLLLNSSPLPRRELLNPILNALCNDTKFPPSIQAAGYDIMSSYWENHESLPLTIPERLSYLSLFLGNTEWGMELWEPKFKALRSLTRYGTEITGIENDLIGLLQKWIETAFQGLLQSFPSMDRAETSERERCMELLVKFLSDVLTRQDNVSRITDTKLVGVLDFYAGLIDRCVSSVDKDNLALESPSASASNVPHPTSTHRRSTSSVSSPSSPTQCSSPSPKPASYVTFRHAALFATRLYLNHLSAHMKTLPSSHLNMILPVLFRALAFCASPLPRLSVFLRAKKQDTMEEKISETLNDLLSGPYTTNCMLILKSYIFPPSTPMTVPAATPPIAGFRLQLMTSLGAHRTLRNHVRRALLARLARAYISKETSLGYSHSGAPGHIELQDDLMETAWSKDDYNTALASKEKEGKEEVLEEAAGVVNDILRELEHREEVGSVMDEEEERFVGLIVLRLTDYIRPMKNVDGSPYIIPITHPNDAPSPILRSVSSFMARDIMKPCNFFLFNIMIGVAAHLTDENTARLPSLMMAKNDLLPTSADWIANWENFLTNDTMLSLERPLTRKAIMDVLQKVYISIKDMTAYRRPLGDLIGRFCSGELISKTAYVDDADTMWKLLGEEIVLRSAEENERDEESNREISRFLDLLLSIASEHNHAEDIVDASYFPAPEVPSPTSPGTATSTATASPTMSRHGDMPSVMSILSSLAGATPSRSQSIQSPSQSEVKEDTPFVQKLARDAIPRGVSAASALVEIFSQLTFTPFSLQNENLLLALRVYDMLVEIIRKGKCLRARLVVLQFLVRLRSDRDHRLYYVSDGVDPNGLVGALASLINRVGVESKPGVDTIAEDNHLEQQETRRARPRFPQERTGRQTSRGRGVTIASRSEPSRSRSRTAAPLPVPPPKPVEPIWRIPESLPFSVSGHDSPSEVLVSYDPDGPDRGIVLPTSRYLDAIDEILEKETSWEILSYVLCYLPVQLANKHLFCGPNSRMATSRMLSIICTGILSGDFASHIEQWPQGLKQRDAHGLAYHTLSVLISYQRCFDLQQRHLLVEIFQAGLNGQPATIKCCLHALSLSAFDLQPSITKCLSRILEKLSQIMSNPNMAVHILGFLSIVGSLPPLHANFTESDYKMVFGVALQYLQHYNRLHSSPTLPMSWALAQHVRILSYFTVYIWFLAVKLPDRPRHVRYITRQLLIANEGNSQVDGPTEVCFDWLARYTYASADPRPTNSVFADIVLNPTKDTSDLPTNQKSWLLGNSIVTIRALARSGWVEVVSRRPSGLSKFVCRLENVPMVGPGDVDPDLTSIAAGLIMERDVPRPLEAEQSDSTPSEICDQFTARQGVPSNNEPPPPDPITGYVWSGTAPSQRRKQVAIDPSFLILQLSPFPDGVSEPFVRRVTDPSALARFVSTLDRIPVIDTHKVGILYVAPGQSDEGEILRNVHGSPAYTRFLEGIGRLINLRGQVDVYAGGLDPDEDGEYAYAWWDDIGQVLYHTATMMPTVPHDPQCNNKKRHIGNDYIRIVWNDSGMPYAFDTLKTQFQFVNIVIEPHSIGPIAAFSNNVHETEYFKVTMQLAPGMAEFAPIGYFKLISAENLPLLIRQLSLLSDWFASVFAETQRDTVRVETKTNWYSRLEAIRRFKNQLPQEDTPADPVDGVMGQEGLRDFTTSF